MYFDSKKDLDYALEFTAAYKSEKIKALREARCLQLQVPYVLSEISDDDLIAGYMKHGFVGFSPQYGGSYTYFYWEDRVQIALDEIRSSVSDEYISQIEDMNAFWKAENTEHKMNKRFEAKYGTAMADANYYYGVARIAGVEVDLGMLVKLGLNGLHEHIRRYERINGESDFYSSLHVSVDVISQACMTYSLQAKAMAEQTEGEGQALLARKKELIKLAEVLEAISQRAPESFYEGLQLIWIYAVCSDLMNFGRIDDILGDLYVKDIDNGIITKEFAIELLSSFYKNIIKVSKVHDSRIVIGGEGRKNPLNADRLAIALIETSRRVVDVVPQLTLRYYSGMNPLLLEEALVNIQSGAVYPIVYSDDTTVPAMKKIYDISTEMARNWVPFGCGEYVLQGYSVATPNTGVTVPQAIDALLHGGYDSFTGKKVVGDNVEIPPLEEITNFEQLFDAYDKIITQAAIEEAYSEHLNYKLAGENACYLHLSLLMHDCIETNKPIFEGGVRYLCATSEIFGLITGSDSLAAIKKIVFEDKLFTLSELVKMLDCNFEGYENERLALLNAPKYGNDDDYADDMAIRVFDHISDRHTEAGLDTMLYRYHIVSVNNSGSAERGAITSATPCGRLRGAALSNGNSPSIGADKCGLTALLNSMAKFDASKHVGVVHNIRFNKDMLVQNRDKIKLLLEIFYKNNGVQTNLSSIGKDDLEQALIHPESYKNLIVRIGGFSARFIELNPIVQREIIERTTYELS